MKTFEIMSPLPELETVEADGFFTRDGLIQFYKREGHDDVPFMAVNTSMIETVTEVS